MVFPSYKKLSRDSRRKSTDWLLYDENDGITFQCIESQTGQTHLKNLAGFAAKFLKYV